MNSPAETASADAVRFEHVGLILGENRILDDICATARGYEYMAEKVFRRSGGIR